MLAYLGLQSIPTEMLYFLAITVFAASVGFGWGTDMVLKDYGFGPVGNALLGVVGVAFGPRIWFVGLGHGWGAAGDPSSLLICAAASGSLLLFAAVVLKRALVRA